MNAAQEMRAALNRENDELKRRSHIRMNVQKIAFSGMEAYKQAHPKWWKRMDGTPILNDLPVVMANVFVEAMLAKRVVDANGNNSRDTATLAIEIVRRLEWNDEGRCIECGYLRKHTMGCDVGLLLDMVGGPQP